MNNLIINKVDEIRNQLTEQKSVNLRTEFEAILPSLQEYEIDYKSILAIDISQTTGELAIRARNLRLNISKIRNNIEKFRKKEKADILNAGRVIDSFGRIIKESLQTGEQQLKEYENYEENQQRLILENLKQKRLSNLQKIYFDKLTENNIKIEDYNKRFGQLMHEPIGSLDDDQYKFWEIGFLEILKNNINIIIVDKQLAINKEKELKRLRKDKKESDLKIAKVQEEAETKAKLLQEKNEIILKMSDEQKFNEFIKIIRNFIKNNEPKISDNIINNKLYNLLSDCETVLNKNFIGENFKKTGEY